MWPAVGALEGTNVHHLNAVVAAVRDAKECIDPRLHHSRPEYKCSQVPPQSKASSSLGLALATSIQIASCTELLNFSRIALVTVF